MVLAGFLEKGRGTRPRTKEFELPKTKEVEEAVPAKANKLPGKGNQLSAKGKLPHPSGRASPRSGPP